MEDDLKVARRDGSVRVGDLLHLSAFLGLLVGVCLWLILHASMALIERSAFDQGDPFVFALMALVLGLIWTVICAVSFTIMWLVLQPSRATWPLLGYVAIVALLVQGGAIFAVDAAITGLHLRPWIDANNNDNIQTAVEFVVGVVPALLASYFAMKRLAHRL